MPPPYTKPLDEILYPPIEPFHTEMLPVTETHSLYVEQSGNPKGRPVIFLHGGPGAATSPACRQFFHPEAYRIILFDQRGCGRSTPLSCLEDNTTWTLVEDIERIRSHLSIDRWLVFGGSWGSTLALAYGVTHPERCEGFFLRGIFTLTDAELDWLYKDGLRQFFPDHWEAFIEPVKGVAPDQILAAYYKLLTSKDSATRLAAAKAWSLWEAQTATLVPDEAMLSSWSEDQFAEAVARIECHFFHHKGWLDDGPKLLDRVGCLTHLPLAIVQGRYDALCPPHTAMALHKCWPGSELTIVPASGHSAFEPGIAQALVGSLDRFSQTHS